MKYKQLTREQRYAISLGLKEGKTQKAIALQIGVSASTVSRELRRNKSHRVYSYSLADEMSRERRERLPGNRKIPSAIEKEALRLLVEEDWSPMQISGYLKRKGYKISHETLYRRIRADFSGELASHCRHKMKYRRHIIPSLSYKSHEHPQPHEYPRTPFGSGWHPLRRLGDGSYRWQGGQRGDPYLNREVKQLIANGKAPRWQEGSFPAESGEPPSVPL